ncbi:FAD/NAD(P)-binding protein [Nocardioides sp. NPDC092400]|uniref:FAD/NAD(P)-binding protein n=1 Tax=Nocardioides sp. NPDC092400 TaxID=3155196 RepID=UPI0034409517
MRVVVVGGGAAGSLVLLHLARGAVAHRDGRGGPLEPVDVVLLDPGEQVSGAAFSTTDPRHLLNVPASGMSVDAEHRFDFVDWCVTQGLLAEGAAPYWFAPRREWARYLRERLAAALADAGDLVSVRHVRCAATAVDRVGDGVRVTLADGAVVDGDRLVLATGLPSVGEDWAPRDLTGQERYVADPWLPGALAPVVDGGGDVVVVGTGLTMVDVAVSILGSSPERRVVACSRAGRLPQPHAGSYLGEVVPDVTGWGGTLAEVRAAVAEHLDDVVATRGDWRPAVDGIRYRVADLWARLDAADRATFLREVAGTWGVHRHRMPPSTASVVDEAAEEGRLEVRAGGVVGVEPARDGWVVELAGGERVTARWLVNCTGPRSDLRRLGDPVLDSLLGLDGTSALAATDPLGLGLATLDGRVVDATGDLQPVWTLGALRRGELWESTAIPEIRVQAARVAADLLDEAVNAAAPLGRLQHQPG